MTYEVENKFAVADLPELRRRIESLGGCLCDIENQADSYFNHPLRDFRLTDEALRIRESNGKVQITFKGPRAGESIKIREEIELPIAETDEGGERAKTFFRRLGFRFVACIHKRRTTLRIQRDKWSILVCLDEVVELGSFVEIEAMSESEDLAQAKQIVCQLQQEIGLGEPILTSYLRMLLAKHSADDSAV